MIHFEKGKFRSRVFLVDRFNGAGSLDWIADAHVDVSSVFSEAGNGTVSTRQRSVDIHHVGVISSQTFQSFRQLQCRPC